MRQRTRYVRGIVRSNVAVRGEAMVDLEREREREREPNRRRDDSKALMVMMTNRVVVTMAHLDLL